MVNRYSRFKAAVRRAVQAVAVVAGVLAFAPASEAALLGIGPSGGPDIMTSAMDITYNAAANTFTATGTGLGNFIPGFSSITDLSYSLSASIDNNGDFSGGQLEVFGTIADLGLGSAGSPISLLTGTLKRFGDEFGAGYSVFEFLFEVDSSAPAIGFGTKGGIVLQSWDLTGDSYASSFSSGVNMNAGDTFAVPEPSMLILLSLGAAGAAVRRRYVIHRS